MKRFLKKNKRDIEVPDSPLDAEFEQALRDRKSAQRSVDRVMLEYLKEIKREPKGA